MNFLSDHDQNLSVSGRAVTPNTARESSNSRQQNMSLNFNQNFHNNFYNHNGSLTTRPKTPRTPLPPTPRPPSSSSSSSFTSVPVPLTEPSRYLAGSSFHPVSLPADRGPLHLVESADPIDANASDSASASAGGSAHMYDPCAVTRRRRLSPSEYTDLHHVTALPASIAKFRLGSENNNNKNTNVSATEHIEQALQTKILQHTSRDCDRFRQILRVFKEQAPRASEGVALTSVSRHEFANALSLLGMYATTEQANKLFDSYDQNKDGCLTIHEFLTKNRPKDYVGERWYEPGYSDERLGKGKKQFLRRRLSGVADRPQTPSDAVFHVTLDRVCAGIRKKIISATPAGATASTSSGRRTLYRYFQYSDPSNSGFVNEVGLRRVLDLLNFHLSHFHFDELFSTFNADRQMSDRAQQEYQQMLSTAAATASASAAAGLLPPPPPPSMLSTSASNSNPRFAYHAFIARVFPSNDNNNNNNNNAEEATSLSLVHDAGVAMLDRLHEAESILNAERLQAQNDEREARYKNAWQQWTAAQQRLAHQQQHHAHTTSTGVVSAAVPIVQQTLANGRYYLNSELPLNTTNTYASVAPNRVQTRPKSSHVFGSMKMRQEQQQQRQQQQQPQHSSSAHALIRPTTPNVTRPPLAPSSLHYQQQQQQQQQHYGHNFASPLPTAPTPPSIETLHMHNVPVHVNGNKESEGKWGIYETSKYHPIPNDPFTLKQHF